MWKGTEKLLWLDFEVCRIIVVERVGKGKVVVLT